MASYDDRYRAFEEEDRLRLRAAARSRLAFPALVLIAFGALGLTIGLTFLVLSIQNPTVMADGLRKLAEQQPPGQQRTELLDELKEAEPRMQLDTPVNQGSCVVDVLLSLAMVGGGIAMRSLGSRGLALTGAIAGMIPIGGCCCFSLPIGIWALVLLQNPGIKAAFAARQSRLEDY